MLQVGRLLLKPDTVIIVLSLFALVSTANGALASLTFRAGKWLRKTKFLGFKKHLHLKISNVQILGFYFLYHFYAGHIKFHILIVTYEFSCQSIENNVTERMVYRMFFLGHNFVLGLLCTLKAKKT